MKDLTTFILEGMNRKKIDHSTKNALSKMGIRFNPFDAVKNARNARKTQNNGNQYGSEHMQSLVTQAMTQGHLNVRCEDGKVHKFGISRENIYSIADPNDLHAEQLNRLIDKLENEGYKFKYETNKEWEKAGYEDPVTFDPNEDPTPESIKVAVTMAMQQGYLSAMYDGTVHKFGISRENIYNLVDQNDMSREQLDRLIDTLEREGVEFKYETNDEWRRAGYEDPE